MQRRARHEWHRIPHLRNWYAAYFAKLLQGRQYQSNGVVPCGQQSRPVARPAAQRSARVRRAVYGCTGGSSTSPEKCEFQASTNAAAGATIGVCILAGGSPSKCLAPAWPLPSHRFAPLPSKIPQWIPFIQNKGRTRGAYSWLSKGENRRYAHTTRQCTTASYTAPVDDHGLSGRR